MKCFSVAKCEWTHSEKSQQQQRHRRRWRRRVASVGVIISGNFIGKLIFNNSCEGILSFSTLKINAYVSVSFQHTWPKKWRTTNKKHTLIEWNFRFMIYFLAKPVLLIFEIRYFPLLNQRFIVPTHTHPTEDNRKFNFQHDLHFFFLFARPPPREHHFVSISSVQKWKIPFNIKFCTAGTTLAKFMFRF